MNRNDETTPAAVLTMVSRDLLQPDHAEAVERQTAEAGGLLAPILKVMLETGLTDDGYRAALLEHMTVSWDLRDVPAAAQESLAAARQLVRERADLRSVPPALIVFNHAVITVFGDPLVGAVPAWLLQSAAVELC